MNDREFILTVARLAHSSPHHWKEFLEALDRYTDAQCELLLKSPPEKLQHAQGWAQASVQLRDKLSGATKVAEQIATKQAQKPMAPR